MTTKKSAADVDAMLSRLQRLADRYNKGHHQLCFDMASNAQQLLSGTPTQTKLRSALLFTSPMDQQSRDKPMTLPTLVTGKVSGKPFRVDYYPIGSLDRTQTIPVNHLNFSEWWDKDVIYRTAPHNKEIYRSTFVEMLTTKAKAAKTQTEYRKLLVRLDVELDWGSAEVEFGGRKLDTNDGSLPFGISVFGAMMRQIAHEILEAYGESDKLPRLR